MKVHSIILLILIIILTGAVPAQGQSARPVKQDTSVDSVEYLLALTRDGVVKVAFNGDMQLIIPGVGAGRGLEVLNDRIYVTDQLWGSSIHVYDLQGQSIRTISTPPEASQYMDFVVLPDERIALLDNRQDKVYFTNESGQLLATVNILDSPDGNSQCLNGAVAEHRLVVAEDGYRNVLQFDLNTFQASILKNLSSLNNNLCAIGYSDGRFYVSLMGWPNNRLYSFTENGSVTLVATIPGEHVTGIVVSGSTAYTALNHAGVIYAVNVDSGAVTTLSSTTPATAQ
jgi:sugar lactone lactonase YvrE